MRGENSCVRQLRATGEFVQDWERCWSEFREVLLEAVAFILPLPTQPMPIAIGLRYPLQRHEDS